jgi:hypothetical protein
VLCDSMRADGALTPRGHGEREDLLWKVSDSDFRPKTTVLRLAALNVGGESVELVSAGMHR